MLKFWVRLGFFSKNNNFAHHFSQLLRRSKGTTLVTYVKFQDAGQYNSNTEQNSNIVLDANY